MGNNNNNCGKLHSVTETDDHEILHVYCYLPPIIYRHIISSAKQYATLASKCNLRNNTNTPQLRLLKVRMSLFIGIHNLRN